MVYFFSDSMERMGCTVIGMYETSKRAKLSHCASAEYIMASTSVYRPNLCLQSYHVNNLKVLFFSYCDLQCSVWVMMNKQTRGFSKFPEEVRVEIEPYFVEQRWTLAFLFELFPLLNSMVCTLTLLV